MASSRPPDILLQIFRWYCDPRLADHIEGDLIETWQERMRMRGARMANVRLALELVLLFRPGIIRGWQLPRFVTTFSMYKSFIIIAWRNFLKSKGYSSINILGLAIALCACLLILLFVQHELSFDRFYQNADRLYRVNHEIKFNDNHLNLATAGPMFGATARAELPQINSMTRLRWAENLSVRKGDETIRQSEVAYADSTFFEVFPQPVISGDARTALTEPNSVVLTESVALKFFGTTDVVGKTLILDNDKTRKVTAVIENIPSNSHFQFKCFVPMIDDDFATENTWAGSQNYNTYFLVQPGTDPIALQKALTQMMNRHLEPELKTIINKSVAEFESEGDYFRLSLTPVTDIHLYSHRIAELYGGGKIEYIYLFSAIAAFILIIAIINFMNLATARSANRAREVGVRKVMGSLKTSLVQQFMMESVLTCALSMLIALALTVLALPQFNVLTGKTFDASILYTPAMLATFFSLVVIVGILAGSYPAFYLSAFRPVMVLKGTVMGAGRSVMRNALVVFQFVAAVTLIAGTIVIYLQMDYMRKRDLGYHREQVLVVDNVWSLGDRVDVFRDELLRLSGVERATISGFLPVSHQRTNNTFFRSPNMDISGAVNLQAWWVDDQYVRTLSMEIVEGRDFSRHIASDSTAVILNESAARFLGGKNIIGMKLYTPLDMEGKELQVQHVVGIVKDFNFSTLRDKVGPLALMSGTNRGSVALKLQTADISHLMIQVEEKWKTFAPGLPFEYSFLDEDYDRLYEGERQVGSLMTIFASLSIFISCLGLFGLATFMAERRSKEIGIRKVLGATVYGITSLLSRDFLRLVVLAVAIATPLAWYLTSRWLEGFAYRIAVSWWIFPLAGIVAVVIAVLTVGYQSVRAAMANPAISLRNE